MIPDIDISEEFIMLPSGAFVANKSRAQRENRERVRAYMPLVKSAIRQVKKGFTNFKIMELELKHIAPYLAHGINISHFDAEREKISVCRISSISIDEATLINSYYEYHEEIRDLRPILHPKSHLLSLRDEIIIRWGGGLTEKAKDKWVAEIIDNMMFSSYKALTYDEVEFMLENHVDVFGLIDVGLSVDLNTIK